MLSVAIVQPALAHYRLPIYRALCLGAAGSTRYTIFADVRSPDGVRTVPYDVNGTMPGSRGLTWRVVRNHWLGKLFLWQTAALAVAVGREFQVVIFAGSMYHLSTWLGLALAKLTGKRTLLWTHGVLRRERGPKGLLRRSFYRMADGLLLYGNRAKRLLAEQGFPPETLYVVYNSLDHARQCRVRANADQGTLAALRSQLFPHPEHPIVIFVGRLTAQKKVHLLLQAAGVLRERGFPVNVLLLGDGPERDRLEALAWDSGLREFVRFHGETYDEEEIGPLISAASACVSPGEVGLACMHSLVYGTPVITHDNPDAQMPEWEAIEPGKTGALFAENDVHDLARVLHDCLVQWSHRNGLREACSRVIDTCYNPSNQCSIFEAAVRGCPAP